MTLTLPDFAEIARAAIAALPAALAVIVGACLVRFLVNRGLILLADRTRLTHGDIAPVRKVAGWFILAATVVLLLGVFGFNLGGLWAVLSTILGLVAIGFVAVWSVLSNISCTMVILFFRPFAVGDEVEFAGEPVKGKVVDLNFLYTTLETDDGALLQIPNNMFFQKVVRRRPGAGEPTASLAEQLSRREPVGRAA
ncbi:MAG: mechanosensitive ion channel [Opitutaceae bacterium]|nr:mechanosensitive ion channel [Opitutaceae bacterium]